MQEILWTVDVTSVPSVLHYCKKCGRKTSFVHSEKFRINAQQRNLDIWLIYKCSECDTTWNAEIYSRISPQKISNDLLERFHHNDALLAKQYALDPQFLQRNDVQLQNVEYTVSGPAFDPHESTELMIRCPFPLPVRVSKVIREKLGLSQKEYLALLEEGRLRSEPEKDLRKCRLGNEITILFKAAEHIEQLEHHA